MNGERLGDDFADAHPRIERGEWVLKHHLHLAALRAQLFSAKREKIASLEADFPAIGLDQPQEHARQGGFPQPLSPTTANVSPRKTEKLTPSTAVKRAPFESREKTPPPRR